MMPGAFHAVLITADTLLSRADDISQLALGCAWPLIGPAVLNIFTAMFFSRQP